MIVVMNKTDVEAIRETCLSEGHSLHGRVCGPCETRIHYMTNQAPAVDIHARRAAALARRK